jgi:hypothetical protein
MSTSGIGFHTPAISDSTVAFGLNIGPFSAIYARNGGSLVPIVKSTDPAPFPSGAGDTLFSFSQPVISGGVTAFTADHGTGDDRALYTGTGGPLTTLVKAGDPAPTPGATFSNVYPGPPAIEGSTVAFGSGSGLFAENGGAIVQIAKTSDAAPSGTFLGGFGNPSISGSKLAFYGGYGSGSSAGSGIFTSSGGSKTTIVKAGDPAPIGAFTDFYNHGTDSAEPSPISGNTVAFFANYKSNVFPMGSGSGIFTGSGGALTAIAKTGDAGPFEGPPMLNFSSPAIAGNWVAFQALYHGLSGTGSGIIARNGSGPLVSVIQVGDTLFGGKVTYVSFSSFGLDTDGSGRLAFQYQLQNGVNGIAIAQLVPEPTSFMLGSFVALSFATRRFNRRAE